jgi:hypothetical protein
MITFAEELSRRIKESPRFWSDVESVSAEAIQFLLPGSEFTRSKQPADESLLWRVLRSASALSQSSDEKDQGLAQDLALFISLVTRTLRTKTLACDLLSDLGNHPGVEKLIGQIELPDESLFSAIRRGVLRAMNTVSMANSEYALTDFQFRLWSRLKGLPAGAVSAPTSAGKSFVVIEHLCKRAIESRRFSAIFIAPTRALLAEVQQKLTTRLQAHSENIRVSTIPTFDQEDRPKQIFVLTQERLQVLLAISGEKFDLVIADEAQGIGDDSRGIILQDCLEKLAARGSTTQFLFLAPGASGFPALADAVNIDEIAVHETELSPVVQNRIIVQRSSTDETQLDLALLTSGRRVNLGSITTNRGFSNARTVLAAVAIELGSGGGSLVYGTGPSNAEFVASQLASDLAKVGGRVLEDLSAFVKEHVHLEYSLVEHIKRGVAFHYGKMPSLLREALEQAFKDGQLRYLVCTTTLFQGVNLPARNVFISTPTRGRNAKLDAAALWNFAGRAGRLGEDIAGNVFLIDYDSWETKPFTEKARFAIEPSFRRMVSNNPGHVSAFLRREPIEEPQETVGNLEAAAGLLLARAAQGTLERFVKRTLRDAVSERDQTEILTAAEAALKEIDLPPEVLIANWTVNPFGQARLLQRFREKIEVGKAIDLVPIHPDPWKAAYARYIGIFSRLNREIFGKSASPKFNSRLTGDALRWMSGHPLPRIIKDRLDWKKKENPRVKPDSVIRDVFEFIEDQLRFKYVQLGRCYVDLLRFALREAGEDELAKSIYDFPLALELGVSSIAGQAFIELGLSRITSAALEGTIPDSKPTVDRAREWLSGLTFTGSKLSRVIWDELERKGLVAAEPLE